MDNTESFSTNVFGGHNVFGGDRRRGIVKHDGVYTATTQADSRDFKTLRGAVAHMARYGFDAHGNRIGQ